MLAATILPQPYLDMIRNEKYHMALAHLINKEGFEEYTEFYENIGKDKQKFLIMDNGLIEGDPRPIEELVEKAEQVNADELVLPDVYVNKLETLREAYDAFMYAKAATRIRLMAVPQGNSYDEWLECAKEMLTWGIDTIGIPKVLTYMNGRDGRLKALLDLQDELQGGPEVHLLGCWESPLELKVIENFVRAGKIKPVRGVDSAIAYVYSRAGLKISEAERPEGPVDFLANDANRDLLQYNIDIWKSEVAALPPLDDKSGGNVIRIFP